jgi:hypothetical protein
MIECFEKIVFYLLEGAGDAGAGGHRMAAALELLADFADIDRRDF